MRDDRLLGGNCKESFDRFVIRNIVLTSAIEMEFDLSTGRGEGGGREGEA
jgi:hypothetical protein